MAAANLALLAQQYFANRGGFRCHAHEQHFGSAATPAAGCSTIDPGNPVRTLGAQPEGGIRSQLFNRETQRLEDDFLCLPDQQAPMCLMPSRQPLRPASNLPI